MSDKNSYIGFMDWNINWHLDVEVFLYGIFFPIG